MTGIALPAVSALTHRYLLDHPHEAARRLEGLSPADIAALLAGQPPHSVVRAWSLLANTLSVDGKSA